MEILESKVRGTIKKYGMFRKADKVIVGVSGGPDSVALIHLLFKLRRDFGIKLYVAHLHHMFRLREGEKEVRFVRELAGKFDLPFFSKHVDVPSYIKEKKLSPQAGAREVRYRFFKELAHKIKAEKIALGHNLDDQAETMLINLMRGSGRTGLGGIPPVEDMSLRTVFKNQGLTPIRVHPLIQCSRREILQYLKNKPIKYCIDASNLKPIYLRNKIRLNLLPYLAREYNPRIKETLFRTSLILQEEDKYLEGQASRAFYSLLKRKKTQVKNGEKINLDIKKFLKLPPALQPRVLREAMRIVKGNLERIAHIHIDDLLKLIRDAETKGHLDLPRVIAQKGQGKIAILKSKGKN